ncbi:hypothetical protein SETIT_5G337100v2 [Setaria italica]|uniref:Plus3 domain-containing protein n=1 Tax=Setaria italica TaxID=4555 RepID=A0A368RDE3_SETIT|nr:uncharacterized protein LOC101778960 [Setaria italica]RCV27600.1 hypothetical protein SETIT_5G337100v2 [Setaria italica]
MSPLSELVWSPDEGLSIKIAASSLSTRKASLRWNADTLSIVISSPQQSGAGGAKSSDNIYDNPEVSEKMPSQLRTRSDSSVRVTANPNRIATLDALRSTSMRSHEQDSRINVMNEGKEGSENCCMDKPEDMKVGSCPTRRCEDASHSSPSRKKVMASVSENQVYCATTVHNERSWATNAWRARLIKAVCQKDSMLPKNTENALPPSSLGISCDAGEFSGKLVGFIGNRNVQTLGNDSNLISNVPAIHSHGKHQDPVLQESHKDEPVVARGESASAVNAVEKCESAPGVDARKLEKGKEKVIYNDSNFVSNTKESDDSNESIESCTSTKAPKRKHSQCSEAKLPFGNKRFRRGDNESSCSGLLEKCGSSFFNWMSSLTNGLPMLDEATAAVPLDQKFSASTGEGSAAPPLLLQNNSGIPMHSVGFNSLFQSLYTRNVMITSRNNCHQLGTGHVFNRLALELNNSNSVLDKQIGMGRETLNVTAETLAAERLQMVSGGSKGNFHNQIDIFPTRLERNMKLPNSSQFCSKSLEEKQNECTVGCSNDATRNKGGFGESLWVSRLLPKTSLEVMEATPCNADSAVNPNAVGDKLYCPSLQNFNAEKELNGAQNLTSRGSSDGATSSKYPAMPPEEPKQSETMASVFAKRLDALRHAKTSAVRLAIACDRGMPKLNNHKTNSFVVSYNSRDELEAGQETHKSSSGNGRIVLWAHDKVKEQSNEELRGNMSEHKHQDHGGSTAAPQHNLQVNTWAEDIDTRRIELKEGSSDVMAGLPDNKQIVPYGIMPNVACDESSVVFGALHRLRLSRSDIIRWLRSPIMHTTLDGFFVRLRFGKWEEALGGTGYHVARLNGALDRNRLSVTIRNSTCQVDSRFVSNHDFHEDELKAWWSAAMKGEWKLPSKEELSMKLRERELLRS